MPRDDSKDRCVFCEAIVTIEDDVPLVDDDEAWRRAAKEHKRSCEWIGTRAGRIKPGAAKRGGRSSTKS